MAKIPYSKFKIKCEEKIKKIQYNEIEFEIQLYLPIQEKLQLISNVINKSRNEDYNYFNSVKVDIFTKLEIVFFYTNITFTEKQKENIPKLYDELSKSGLLNLILNNIPEQELRLIFEGCEKAIKSIYEYQNSAFGILEGITKDFDETRIDVKAIQDALISIQDSNLYQSILPLIGDIQK